MTIGPVNGVVESSPGSQRARKQFVAAMSTIPTP